MTTRVLLTGGAGYIGSHTCLALLAAGHEVVILDDFSNAKRSVIDRLGRLAGRRIAVAEQSVLDRAGLEAVVRDHRIGAVVHFAAKKAVGESVRLPLDYAQVNIAGLVTLMQVMAGAGVFRLVFSSSATVYGTPGALPVPESAPTGHTSPYGFTKLVSEEIIAQARAADPRWQTGVLRYFNPAGAHASGLIGEDPADIPNNLMPYVARVATGELAEIRIFGGDYPTPDGTGVRDYVHVEDLAEGHVRSLAALLDGQGSHLVNLGTGRGHSVLEVIAAYGRAAGRDLPWRMAPRRDGDIAACWADCTRAAEVLGFRATRTLDEMCASSWHWMQTGAREMT